MLQLRYGAKAAVGAQESAPEHMYMNSLFAPPGGSLLALLCALVFLLFLRRVDLALLLQHPLRPRANLGSVHANRTDLESQPSLRKRLTGSKLQSSVHPALAVLETASVPKRKHRQEPGSCHRAQ